MKRKSDNHLQIIQAALDAIEAGIRRPLDIDQVARDAGMSFWHFQRTFTALAGEPVGSYVRRRRLGAAARELLRSRRRILDVALDYQFESHSAFTRAFRAMFGRSPDQFRREPVSFQSARPRLTGERLRHLQRIPLQPNLVELPALHLLGMSARFLGIGSDQANNTVVPPQVWREFLPRQSEIERRGAGACYGAWDSLPVAERSDPDELQYLAAIAVSPSVERPRGMVLWSAPAMRYARFTHKGPIHRISETISYIYAVWLPRAKLERGASFDLELYDHRFSVDGEHSEVDYLVPLAG